MKKEAFQKKVQLFYLIPWKVFHWQLKDFELLTANYCRRTSRDIRRNQEKTLLRNHLVDSASTPVDNRLNKTLIYFIYLIGVGSGMCRGGAWCSGGGFGPTTSKSRMGCPTFETFMFEVTAKTFFALMKFPAKAFWKGLGRLFISVVSWRSWKWTTHHVVRLQPQFPVYFIPGKRGFLPQIAEILIVIAPMRIFSR